MNNQPHFSIIIPTLNEASTLPSLLNDLLHQTWKDFEVIVVDANSEDKTAEKAEPFRYKFPNFRIIVSQQRNVAYQRNLGAGNAFAHWIIFMDSDDRIPPYFLQGIKYRIEATNPDILSTWFQADTHDTKDQAIASIANLYIEIQKTTKKPSVLEAMLCCKRDVFLRLGGFDTSRTWGEGGELVERAVKRRLRYEVVRDPKYTYSLRRLRTQGTLKSTRNIARLELARLLSKRFSIERTKFLYPMEGGTYFRKPTEKQVSRLARLVQQLYRNTPLANEPPKQGILSRLFAGKPHTTSQG